MSFFTNKHVIIAMIVAPILAVMTYIAVDRHVRPDPVAAKPGDSYELVARSNCRYESGKCTLYNGDFKIELNVADAANQTDLTLDLNSEFPLEGFRYALVDTNGDEIHAQNVTTSQFSIDKQHLKHATTMLLAVRSADIIYYTETETRFMSPE